MLVAGLVAYGRLAMASSVDLFVWYVNWWWTHTHTVFDVLENQSLVSKLFIITGVRATGG